MDTTLQERTFAFDADILGDGSVSSFRALEYNRSTDGAADVPERAASPLDELESHCSAS